MQIDGHHTLTYVVARVAGMEHNHAEKLAYSAQYVDEATNVKPVIFDNGAMFERIASAHKMLDYRNSVELSNHLAWIPFHFLPGNDGKKHDEAAHGSFVNRLICRPDSYVARDMLRAVAQYRDKAFGLHLMGIAMHVYADTFAHQGFAGITHQVNEISDLDSSDDQGLLNRAWEGLKSWAVSSVSPLGHGAALSFPDRPYVSWSYENGFGERVNRDNTEIFLEAANKMYKVIKCYLESDLLMNLDAQPDMPSKSINQIEQAFRTIKDDKGDERHKTWLKWLKQGKFGFDPVELKFIPEGKNSWKELARGKAKPINGSAGLVQYTFKEEFLESDWKCFHDALKTFRIEMVRDVLPKYGICIA
ncbi:DUF6765 family protein [Agarivorans sp. DSG3-1]|uniref:DUF6765 family protein n=1 Tax=Agarivorans sp. DSG3-1 TaxID=3342249 RepID=UPI00398EBDBE